MIYNPPLTEEQLEKKFSKLKKLKYNQFRWWRMYDNKNNPLHKHTPLIDRIKNGDFDYSHYIYQAMWCEHEMNKLYMSIGPEDMGRYVEESSLLRTRRKRLLEDFHKDEKEKMESIIREFSLAFRLPKNEIKVYMEEFGGTLEELYIKLEKKYPFHVLKLPSFLLKSN